MENLVRGRDLSQDGILYMGTPSTPVLVSRMTLRGFQPRPVTFAP